MPISVMLRKKSFVSLPGVSVKTPWQAEPCTAPRARRPPTSTVISGAVSVRSWARSTSMASAAIAYSCFWKLRKPSASGSIGSKLAASVCSSVASVRPAVNGTETPDAASMAATPPRTIRSARETCAPPAALNSACTASMAASALASASGSLATQPFCGARRMRAPLAPPRMSDARNVLAEAQAVLTSSAVERPHASNLALSAVTSASDTGVPVAAGSGSCQIRSSAGTSEPR